MAAVRFNPTRLDRRVSLDDAMTANVEPNTPLRGVAPRKVAIVASLAFSLTNFRLLLLKRLVEAGHEVIAFAPDHDATVTRTLEGIGVSFVRISMARASLNPLSDLCTLIVLWRQFRRLKPDTILAYTMKPIIYGCLAGRLAGVPYRFALVTGLGYVFTNTERTARVALVRLVSILMYRLALGGASKVFVYNSADAELFRLNRIIRDVSRLELIPGSGVDFNHYTRSDPPLEPFTFLLIARLLRDKGVLEYVQAARNLHRRRPEVRVQLLGPFDPNPSGLSEADIDKLVAEGGVEYLGVTRDVRPFLAQCTVFVLPSYREGVPRTVLEAMATGRAIITTDAPGCRETVVDGENGILVPPRDSLGLAKAMETLAAEPELAARMGRRSHELARERFDVHIVNQKLLGAMELI